MSRLFERFFGVNGSERLFGVSHSISRPNISRPSVDQILCSRVARNEVIYMSIWQSSIQFMSLLYNSSFKWTALKWMALSKEPAFPSLARAPSSVELLDFYASRDKCNERIFLYNSVPTSFWNATSLIGKAYSSCDRLLIEHSAQWTCELKEIHFISGCHLQMYLLTAALFIADCCGCGSHYVINK